MTGKTCENGLNSGDGAARSSWIGLSAPGCGDTSKAPAISRTLQGGDHGNLAPGSLSTYSPT